MSTEFISMQPPPGKAALAQFVRGKPHSEQPDTVPTTFLEAMSVREPVFVKEQNVPLENELDDDDHRSWHWVTFVSAGAPKNAPASNTEHRGSTAARMAAATIRLVPPPHEHHDAPSSDIVPDVKTHTRNISTDSAEGEPYIKLGRLATLEPFRGIGLGRLLVDSALAWASEHPDEILPPISATDREAARLEASEDERDALAHEWDKERWRGLVLVHAQTSVQHFWEKNGFTLDKDMGEWDEEGIMHVGMWRRIPLRGRRMSGPIDAIS